MLANRGLKGFSKGSGISGESNLPSRSALSRSTFVDAFALCRGGPTSFRNNVPSAARTWLARFHRPVSYQNRDTISSRAKLSRLSVPLDVIRSSANKRENGSAPNRNEFLRLDATNTISVGDTFPRCAPNFVALAKKNKSGNRY